MNGIDLIVVLALLPALPLASVPRELLFLLPALRRCCLFLLR